jgi:hypothetical protein
MRKIKHVCPVAAHHDIGVPSLHLVIGSRAGSFQQIFRLGRPGNRIRGTVNTQPFPDGSSPRLYAEKSV